MILKEIEKMSVERLKELWETVDAYDVTTEIAMVRGWMMDVMYKKLGEEKADQFFFTEEEIENF